MKKLVSLLCLPLITFSAPLLAQGGVDDGQGPPPGMFPSPGQAHRLLGDLVGPWEFSGKAVQVPGSAPVEMQLKLHTRNLAGMWFATSSRGTIGDAQVGSHTITGFDLEQQRIEQVRVSNSPTSLTFIEGAANLGERSIKCLSEIYALGQTMQMREEWNLTDRQQIPYLAFRKAQGADEWKSVEGVHRRKKVRVRVLDTAKIEGLGGTKPGPEHKWLSRFAGLWKGTANFGGKESVVQLRYRVSYGGFWLIGGFKSSFLGRPFLGQHIMGYDPREKTFEGAWIDSLNSSLFKIKASRDGDKLVQTVSGYSDSEGRHVNFKSVVERVDGNTLTWSRYDLEDGKEVVVETITYKLAQ